MCVFFVRLRVMTSQNLPTELLAESFAEKPKEKKPTDKDAKAKEAAAAAEAAKKKKAERVELLDGKTLRNTGIAFKRFRSVPGVGVLRVCLWPFFRRPTS